MFELRRRVPEFEFAQVGPMHSCIEKTHTVRRAHLFMKLQVLRKRGEVHMCKEVVHDTLGRGYLFVLLVARSGSMFVQHRLR